MGFFPDFVLPGYSGYIPQSRRKPEAAGAFGTVTIKIPNEPVPQGRKIRKKKPKREKTPLELPKRVLSAEEQRLHDAALAKAALETKKALTIPVGPVPYKSFPQIQREFNAISYPAFYQHPVMYPAPHFRNPPTHRSCARHRDMRQLSGACQVVQQPGDKQEEERLHNTNIKGVCEMFDTMSQTRTAKAKAEQEAFTRQQNELLIAKGIMTAEEIEAAQDRTPKPLQSKPPLWDYNDPKVYRSHSVLFMNSYQKPGA